MMVDFYNEGKNDGIKIGLMIGLIIAMMALLAYLVYRHVQIENAIQAGMAL